ncbi:TPA: gfo/Idh/MocA family oxidoreductase, partial [Candidatus Bathyarchaeota archaeon]|nr:gfo/Idh/MocA family oxidoreductase [Candidatus Bathyarchaeota archaeon]
MRVAVIGVGRWGINHVRVCKHLKDEGLCDGIVACDK